MSMSSLETRIESISSAPAFLPTSTFDVVAASHSVAAPGVGVVFKANLIKRDYKVLVVCKNGETLKDWSQRIHRPVRPSLTSTPEQDWLSRVTDLQVLRGGALLERMACWAEPLALVGSPRFSCT